MKTIGMRCPATYQFLLKIWSAHARQSDVEDQAARLVDGLRREERFRRRKRLDGKADCCSRSGSDSRTDSLSSTTDTSERLFITPASSCVPSLTCPGPRGIETAGGTGPICRLRQAGP